MSYRWRVFREVEPRTLAHDQLVRWREENSEVVEADKKFVTVGNCLCFSNVLPAKEAEAVELCGELCANKKPCVRRKGHAINKRWGHMASLAPKKEDSRVELLGIADFPPGSWDGGCRIER